jgi:hypothetical protein
MGKLTGKGWGRGKETMGREGEYHEGGEFAASKAKKTRKLKVGKSDW